MRPLFLRGEPVPSYCLSPSSLDNMWPSPSSRMCLFMMPYTSSLILTSTC